MRVKFGKTIYLCTRITHPEKSRLLIITTSNGVYTVNMTTNESAEYSFNKLLTDGYLDVSKCEHTN